jgi:hypothetical protein
MREILMDFWSPLINYTQSNYRTGQRVARLAPGPTCVAVVLIAIIELIVFYAFFQFRYSVIFDQKDAQLTTRDAKIATLEERIRLRDDQLADKLHSTPPSEARSIIQGLEARLNRLSPRRISESEKYTLIERLKVAPGVSYNITIMHDGACADCNLFAADFSSLFRNLSGWNVINLMGIGIANMPPTGVAVRVGNPSKLTETQRVIVNALKDVGIMFDLQSSAINNSDVELLITAKTTS